MEEATLTETDTQMSRFLANANPWSPHWHHVKGATTGYILLDWDFSVLAELGFFDGDVVTIFRANTILGREVVHIQRQP